MDYPKYFDDSAQTILCCIFRGEGLVDQCAFKKTGHGRHFSFLQNKNLDDLFFTSSQNSRGGSAMAQMTSLKRRAAFASRTFNYKNNFANKICFRP